MNEATIPPTHVPEPSPGPPTLEATVRAQVAILAEHHRSLTESDAPTPEAVHGLRVATRRLQAALDLAQVGAHADTVRPIRRELRGWRRKLTRLRNYDVFLALLASSGRKSQREGHRLLVRTLESRRSDLARRRSRWLARRSVDDLVAGLGLDDPGAGWTWPEPAEVAARATARLEQRTGDLVGRVAVARADGDPEELHQLRIAAKRLRYLLRPLTDLGVGDATPTMKWLRRLQNRLGEWRDLVELEREIVDIVSDPTFLAEHLKESRQLLGIAASARKRARTKARRIFPIRYPQTLVATPRRLVAALRPARRRRTRGSPTRSEDADPTA